MARTVRAELFGMCAVEWGGRAGGARRAKRRVINFVMTLLDAHSTHTDINLWSMRHVGVNEVAKHAHTQTHRIQTHTHIDTHTHTDIPTHAKPDSSWGSCSSSVFVNLTEIYGPAQSCALELHVHNPDPDGRTQHPVEGGSARFRGTHGARTH